MGKSLSLDLRQRVLAFIEEGHSRRHAAAVFRVSISSAIRIADRYRRTGDVAPMPQGRPRGGGKLEAYRAFVTSRVDAAPDITMPELAEALWAAHQVRAAPAVLSRILKHRLGYTYKKNPDRHGPRTRTRASRAISTTGRNRSSDSAMLALMFFWLNVSLAAVKRAISLTPAASAASMPLAFGTRTG